ncbi:hypothetical protein DFH09DRAFT_805353, partial [Mycena vulgaris]
STLAWGAGDNRCLATIVQIDSGNFCDITFTLHGMDGFFDFEGCGGPLWVNRNGAFYANCAPFSEDLGCVFQLETT